MGELVQRSSSTSVPRSPSARTVAPVHPRVADLMSAWAKQAPWMDPKTVAAMAASGVDPMSAEGRQIAAAGAEKKSRHRGLGWHSIGDVVHGAADAVSNAADFVTPESVEHAIGSGLHEVGGAASHLKPVVRGATMALDAGLQTPVGLVRNIAAELGGAVAGAAGGALAGAGVGGGIGLLGGPFAEITAPVGAVIGAGVGAVGGGVAGFFADDNIDRHKANWHPWEWSSAGLAIDHALHGEHVDVGSGLLPGGEVAKEQSTIARGIATIDGKAVTPGRIIASSVFEPGSKPYNVASGLTDAAVALGPADLGGDALKAIGAINGARKVVQVGQADAFLSSRAGRGVVDWMAKQDDFNEIWHLTGKKLPVKTVLAIADEDDPVKVADILRGELGITIREKPDIANLPIVNRTMRRVRMLQEMPGQHLDTADLDDALDMFDAAQRNARFPEATIAANNRKLAEANTPADMYKVVVDDFLSTQLQQELAGHGGQRMARNLTRAWSNWHQELSHYFVDEIGNDVPIPGAVIDGAGKAIPSPHLYTEYLNGSIPLPDQRAIRQATSTMGRLARHGVVDVPVSTADWFMQSMWKPMALLRGAWTVRVVGEEQVRMAASGLTSIVHHPMSHIALMAGNKGKIGLVDDDLLATAEGVESLSRGSGGFVNGNKIRMAGKTTYTREQEEFAQSWGDELAQAISDPIAKRLAGGVDWQAGDVIAADAAGAPIRATGNHLQDVKEWFWGGTGRKLRDDLRGWGAPLSTRADAETYLDSVFQRLQVKTGGNPQLLDLVATGRLNGRKLMQAPGKLDRQLITFLDDNADTLAPNLKAVKGDVWLTTKGRPSARAAQRLDHATEWMFSQLMSRPTNTLSRSPAFRRFYWQRVEELMPAMDGASQARALERARASFAGYAGDIAGAGTVQRLERAAAKGTGALKLADADHVAKGFGLDETKSLLYDLSKKSQFFDIHRLLFPFGEAWKEILSVWTKIGVQHPMAIRRGQQLITAARGADPMESGHGFFYKDANGQEVFAYPGSQWLTEKAIGVPVPLTGRVAGLSIGTSVIPAVGPVVQIPAGSMLPKTPDWDWAREILLPFGEQSTDEGFVESQLPPWLQKLRATGWFRNVPAIGAPSAQQERALAGAAFDLLSWEISTGKRQRPSSPDEIQAAVEENMDKARMLYLIRGAAQWGAPTAPTPEMRALDSSGNLVAVNELRNKYRALADDKQAGGYATATTRFLDQYGEAAFFAIQARSKGLGYGLPSTKEADDWVRAHPQAKRRLPNTYGLWGPAGKTFDSTAYSRQFETGERQALTPEQMVMEANARLGGFVYDQAVKAAGDSPNASQLVLLRNVRDVLRQQFPGFGVTIPGVAEKADLDTAIGELRRGLTDRELAQSDAGQGLTLYMQMRDAAQTRAEQLGLANFRTASKAEPLRLLLRRAADVILAQHPDWAPMWENVFSREMQDDQEEAA